jgi:hypothetical protein
LLPPSLSAAELLQLVVDEYEVGEMTHNFAAQPGIGVDDTNLQWQVSHNKGGGKRFFYSIWEFVFENKLVNNDKLVHLVEVDLRGFKAFTGANGTSPLNFTEAQERPIYTALNTLGVDSGNPGFGPISVVFSSQYARNMTFINVADGGLWEAVCNTTYNHGKPSPFWPGPLDCSQPTAPGTFGALNHNILAAEMLWKHADIGRGNSDATSSSSADSPASNSPEQAVIAAKSPLLLTLQRLFQDPPPAVSTQDQIKYLEPDIAGAVFIPDGIKFVIGVFSALFGTADGKLLQEWCVRNGWALLWAPGFFCTPGNTPQHCTAVAEGRNGTSSFTEAALTSGFARMVDPIVQQQLSRPLNVSAIGPDVTAAFVSEWERVGNASSAAGTGLAPASVMTAGWWHSWQTASHNLPTDYAVRAMQARQCHDENMCIGVSLSRTRGRGAECVCYHNQHKTR